MKNKKIQLALLVLMTSGFSAVYAPEMGEPLEEGGGSGEGEGGGGAGEGGEGGTIAEREGGQDGNNGGKPNGPVETTGGGSMGFTPEELASQQTALATLAKQISTVADSSTFSESGATTLGRKINNSSTRWTVDGNVVSINNIAVDLSKSLNRGDMDSLQTQSTKLEDTLSALEGIRDTMENDGEDVTNMDTFISNTRILQKQVDEYIETFGDSGNHSLADNALTSLGSLLGKTTLSSQDIQDVSTTLRQLLNNASLDYLQANKSRIASILKKMQSTPNLSTDVTYNMTMLDASMKLIDANSIVSDSKSYFGSDFLNSIKNGLSSLLGKLFRPNQVENAGAGYNPRNQIEDAMNNAAAADQQALIDIKKNAKDAGRSYSNAEIGKIKVIIRRMAARRGIMDSLMRAQRALPMGPKKNNLTSLVNNVSKGDTTFNTLNDSFSSKYSASKIIVDMLQADVNAGKQTPLTQMFTYDPANPQHKDALTALVNGMGSIPNASGYLDDDVESGDLRDAASILNDAVIFARKVRFLFAKFGPNGMDLDPFKKVYSQSKLESMGKTASEFTLSSPIAVASIRSSLKAIAKALYPTGSTYED